MLHAGDRTPRPVAPSPVLKHPDNVNGRLDNITRVLDFQLHQMNVQLQPAAARSTATRRRTWTLY